MPTAVADVSAPAHVSADLFEREYAHVGEPIVLRGLLSGWPALGWDFPDVRRHLPRRPLKGCGVVPPDGLSLRRIQLSPDEIVQRLSSPRRDPDDPPDWFFDVESDLPELAEAVPAPPVHRRFARYSVLLGRDTVTHGHYHATEHALICQVHGRKRVLLYSPSDSPLLYPYPVFFKEPRYDRSRIDFSAPDFDAFPKAAAARRYEALLEPGDALFIPVQWWHAVYGVGAVMSTSLLWPARLLDHRFPHPGLRTVAGALRWRVWPALRRLALRR